MVIIGAGFAGMYAALQWPAGAVWMPLRLRQYLDPERVIDLCNAAYSRRIALTEQKVLPMIDGWFVLLILSFASSIGGLVPLLKAKSMASDED